MSYIDNEWEYFIGDYCKLCGGNEYESRGARGVNHCLTCEMRGVVGGIDYLEGYLTYLGVSLTD